MSGINWKKDADLRRMQRQGVEDRAATSKDALRREADRLLAGYTGPVTKLPAGPRVSGEFPRSDTGNISSQPSADRPQIRRKSKGKRQQRDLFGTVSKSKPRASAFDRAVPPGLVIYCDGACEPNPGAGGWGFVVYNDGVEVHADCGGSNPTTNNVMEMTSALMALQWFAEQGARHGGARPRLFCDSMYVVNGCNDWRHSWKAQGWRRKGKNPEIANLDLWKELDAALTALPIELEWVKGHVGIIGNERADELSLMGREAVLALQPDPLDLIREQLDYSARGWD